ncbi:MAG: ADP-ribosylglycohydrolase family protein [Bacteroidales bacterium]|nr:ADP-ribosylglycohydrolase family protein [Bacteroidales bacterium]
MIGAIVGDIVGSRFEWNNIKTKDFELFHEKCDFTDDSVLTIAAAKAILESRRNKTDLAGETVKWFREIGPRYPGAGYGVGFYGWLWNPDPKPYNSCGNGAAMRVSACGYAAGTIEEAVELSRAVTGITHSHPEGLKGAEATAVAIVMARNGITMPFIRDYICKRYYDINFTLDEIRPRYEFDETCQGTVPQAFEAFFESTSYEDAIRNAISIGGDSDTIGAITGGIAGAYWGVPQDIREKGMSYLDEELKEIVLEFEKEFPFGKEGGK